MNLHSCFLPPFFVLLAIAFLGCSAPSQPPQVFYLITDAKLDSPLRSQLYGTLRTLSPVARLEPIFQLPSGTSPQTAYQLSLATQRYPAGSIFIIPTEGALTASAPVLFQTRNNHYYLAPDDGLLHYILHRDPLNKAWRLDRSAALGTEGPTNPHPWHDLLLPAASLLARGVEPGKLGTPLPKVTLLPALATIVGRSWRSEILTLTREGDAIIDAHGAQPDWLTPGKAFRVAIGRAPALSIPLLAPRETLPKGRPYLRLTGDGFLILGVQEGSAAQIFRLKEGDALTITP